MPVFNFFGAALRLKPSIRTSHVHNRNRRFLVLQLLTVVLAFAGFNPVLFGAVVVSTQHNDTNRTGANPQETILNTANVHVATFGKIFSRPVDGQIYAQPLYIPAVVFPSQTHNVVYVCTEHNSVYAFDADNPASPVLWHVNLGPSVPSSVLNVTRNILPEIGITATPVVDAAAGILFVVAETYESGRVIFRLHALDLATGAEHFNAPAVIQGSVPGTGLGSSNGVLAFDSAMHWQRAGLLLLNGNVYIGFGSHLDNPPFHGWIFGYSARNLQQVAVLCLSPDADSAGLWQGGVGLAADSGGNIYAVTGDGLLTAYTGGRDYGDSIVKISTAGGLRVLDYFSPSDQASLGPHDIDFGSGGPVLLPGTSLIVAGGKDGRLFVASTNNLGQFHAVDQIVQSWQATYNQLTTNAGGIFGGSVYYNSRLYVWGKRDYLKVFAFNGTQFNSTPVSQGTFTIASGNSNEPAMSFSSNGTTAGTGILWAAYDIDGFASDGLPHPGILRAFDASDVTKELWNSEMNPVRDSSGSWAKWSPPTIANGKVYLATFDGALNVYGLLTSSGGGVLAGSADSNTSAANITSEGPADWVHWGDPGVNRKAGVTAQIGNYSIAGSGSAAVYTNDPRPLSWSDGTPTAISSLNRNGVFVGGLQNGLSITAPAGTISRRLTLHVGGSNSGGTLTAHLSDGSAPDFVDTTSVVSGQYDRNYTLTYNAGSAGQFLTVTWKMTSGTGGVSLSAAALAMGDPGNITMVTTGGTPQSATVNTAFTAPFRVMAKDGLNNPIAGITVTFTAPATGPSGTFGGSLTATAVTASNGVATSPAFTANGRAGAFSVVATAVGAASPGVFSLTNNPGPPAVITATAGTPQSALVNTMFPAALEATVRDAGNNAVSGATVTFTAPAGGAAGRFNGSATATAATASNGVAIAPAFTANGQAGTYTVAATVPGVSAPASFSLTNTPVTSAAGILSGSMIHPSGTVNLTAEGTSDWAHWGLANSTDFDHKAVSPKIGNFTLVGTQAPARYGNNSVGFTWTDGTPTATATATTTGIYVGGQGSGFRLTAPADTTLRTLRVYVGAWRARGQLVAHLSDGSAPDFTDASLTNSAGVTTLGVYTLAYKAASAGQSLTVTFTLANLSSGFAEGNVTLQSATLGGGVAAPDFTLAAAPSSQSAVPGSTTAYQLSITALNGFTGSVGFAVAGLPAGVTSSFSPATITAGGLSTMSLTVGGGTVPGTYPLTVTATAGSVQHSAKVSLIVTSAAGFALAAGPSSQSVAAGRNAAYTVTVTALGGFAGNVTFRVAGLPAGVQAAFSPATVTGKGSSVMTIATEGGTPAGSYSFTITGTSGTLSHTANVTLIISPLVGRAVPPSPNVSRSPHRGIRGSIL